MQEKLSGFKGFLFLSVLFKLIKGAKNIPVWPTAYKKAIQSVSLKREWGKYSKELLQTELSKINFNKQALLADKPNL